MFVKELILMNFVFNSYLLFKKFDDKEYINFIYFYFCKGNIYKNLMIDIKFFYLIFMFYYVLFLWLYFIFRKLLYNGF